MPKCVVTNEPSMVQGCHGVLPGIVAPLARSGRANGRDRTGTKFPSYLVFPPVTRSCPSTTPSTGMACLASRQQNSTPAPKFPGDSGQHPAVELGSHGQAGSLYFMSRLKTCIFAGESGRGNFAGTGTLR